MKKYVKDQAQLATSAFQFVIIFFKINVKHMYNKNVYYSQGRRERGAAPYDMGAQASGGPGGAPEREKKNERKKEKEKKTKRKKKTNQKQGKGPKNPYLLVKTQIFQSNVLIIKEKFLKMGGGGVFSFPFFFFFVFF